MKFDVSTANDKIGYMRSLNLVCVKNSKEFQSKLNWDVLSPGTILPVKECSVVLSGISCNSTGELNNNQADRVHYRNLHSQSCLHKCKIQEYCHKEDISKESCGQSIEVNISETIDEIDLGKINARKRKSNNGVTLRVTLKIGDEVISKKYCKKKYLDKENVVEQTNSRVNHHTDCEKCSYIKCSLRSSQAQSNVITRDQIHREKSDAESSTQTDFDKKRLMAAALVDFELQRLRLNCQNIHSNNLCKIDPVVDAVVSKKSEVIPIKDEAEKNLHLPTIQKKRWSDNNSASKLIGPSVDTNYEIITIDDEICNDTTDDCLIVDEFSSDDYSKEKENSYDYNVMDSDKSISKHQPIENGGKAIKRQKLRNLNSQILVNHSEIDSKFAIIIE